MGSKIQVTAGNVKIGGGAKVSVQSMLNIPSTDIEGSVRQAKELEEAGCEIIRAAIPNKDAVKLIPALKEAVSVPIVADIHFDYKLALEACAAGIDKIRINPGNIGSDDRVKAVADAANIDETDPTRFYREYYDNLGDDSQTLQGDNTAGGLGLDAEFLENAILYAAIPYGFFGLSSDAVGSLNVAPVLPQAQEYWEIENLMFNGAKYDLRITDTSAELWEVRNAKAGMTLTVKLKKPENSFSVVVNGKTVTDYTEKDGYLYVTMPFADGYVVVR